MRALLLLALAAGCHLQATHSLTLPGSSSSTTTTPSSESSSDPERFTRPSEEDEKDSFLSAEQLASLSGLTVGQATAKARSYGHDGKVEVVELDDFLAGCKPNTVCFASNERGGRQDVGIHETLLLRTNKTLSITPPPAD